MVARLKLKEIDGRAPPGVNAVASAPETESVFCSLFGGKAVKLRGTPVLLETRSSTV
jgi:hypothetical protein